MPSSVLPDPTATADSDFGPRTVNKVMLRLIPFIVLLYLLNYVDRVNVSFAKLAMKDDLHFSENVFGIGFGIFFVAYFLFEVPSNLIMERVGARRWIARIMISWGLISSAMMFAHQAWLFYVLRFALGAAEAGFAPGILLYLTWWIPIKEQGRAVAWFLTSTALAGAIGAPIAGLLLRLDGASLFGHALKGWQWLFLLEGIPSVLCGLVALWFLTDRPADARWLTDPQRRWLDALLATERAACRIPGQHSLLDAFSNSYVWLLNGIYGALMLGFQGINYWMPTIIEQATGWRNKLHIGLLTSIPFATAAICMVLVGRHSDRTGERRWHTAVAASIGAGGLAICIATSNPWITMLGLCIAAGGIWSTLGPFWAVPPAFLTGTAAAAGIAMINSSGNLIGGYGGNQVMGYLRDRTGSYKWGLAIDVAVLLFAAALMVLMRRRRIAQ